MPLLTNYQNLILESVKKYDFLRIRRFIGRCHDALIGEWINWWIEQNSTGMICNPARSSKKGSKRCIADILFLAQPDKQDYHEVKGVAEVENSENKIISKIESLNSYEKHKKRGSLAYPDLEFAIMCYTLKTPNETLSAQVYSRIIQISKSSNILWIVCQIGKGLTDGETANYSVYMPDYVKGYDRFFYNRNFDSLFIYFIKKGKQIGEILVPREKSD